MQAPAAVAEIYEAFGRGDVEAIEVRSLVGDDSVAVAEIFIDVTVRSTGKRFADEEVHDWSFREDGKDWRRGALLSAAAHHE